MANRDTGECRKTPVEVEAEDDTFCAHNQWDNLRMRHGKMRLKCRVCNGAYTLPSTDALCHDFRTTGECAAGAACTAVHVYRSKKHGKGAGWEKPAGDATEGKQSPQPAQPAQPQVVALLQQQQLLQPREAHGPPHHAITPPFALGTVAHDAPPGMGAPLGGPQPASPLLAVVPPTATMPPAAVGGSDVIAEQQRVIIEQQRQIQQLQQQQLLMLQQQQQHMLLAQQMSAGLPPDARAQYLQNQMLQQQLMGLGGDMNANGTLPKNEKAGWMPHGAQAPLMEGTGAPIPRHQLPHTPYRPEANTGTSHTTSSHNTGPRQLGDSHPLDDLLRTDDSRPQVISLSSQCTHRRNDCSTKGASDPAATHPTSGWHHQPPPPHQPQLGQGTAHATSAGPSSNNNCSSAEATASGAQRPLSSGQQQQPPAVFVAKPITDAVYGGGVGKAMARSSSGNSSTDGMSEILNGICNFGDLESLLYEPHIRRPVPQPTAAAVPPPQSLQERMALKLQIEANRRELGEFRSASLHDPPVLHNPSAAPTRPTALAPQRPTAAKASSPDATNRPKSVATRPTARRVR